MDGWMDGWTTRCYALFKSISVISGRRVCNNERLLAVEPRLRLKRFPPSTGLELGTARSAGQRLTYSATAAPHEIDNTITIICVKGFGLGRG